MAIGLVGLGFRGLATVVRPTQESIKPFLFGRIIYRLEINEFNGGDITRLVEIGNHRFLPLKFQSVIQ